MNIDTDKLKMAWAREGLHIEQDRREIAVADITTLSLLKIDYGSNLAETPEGWFCTRKERIVKWLKEKKEEKHGMESKSESS